MAAEVHSSASYCSPFNMASAGQSLGPIDYVANPQFVFPRSQAASNSDIASSPRRVRSLKSGPGPSTPSGRRNSPQHKSVSALPSFSFNASDTTGRVDEGASSEPAERLVPITPKSVGHRRGASEYVGGGSRFAIPQLVSASPTKSSEAYLSVDQQTDPTSPARKPGHSHRRSAAISKNDLSEIMRPRSSEKLVEPSTSPPFAHDSALHDPFAPTANDTQSPLEMEPSSFERPASGADSRPKVGFSDDLEFIPRALSPISSASESSRSTPASLSVRNSISSVVDFGSASSTPVRRSKSLLSPKTESQAIFEKPRSSLELSRGLDQEGQWLRSESEQTLPATARLDESPQPSSLLGSNPSESMIDDRRGSGSSDVGEAASRLSISSNIPCAHSSSQSLPGSNYDTSSNALERKSSVKKVKHWASTLIGRREKGSRPLISKSRSSDEVYTKRRTAPIPSVTVSPSDEREEPDLEELFSHDPFSQSESQMEQPMPQPRFDLDDPASFSPRFDSSEDSSTMLDLDAAVDSSGTPSSSTRTQGLAARRSLHSSRLNKDFNGPGGHYHRRAESAPVLVSFDFPKSSSPLSSPMADVFEEEEEEDDVSVGQARDGVSPVEDNAHAAEEQSMGIEIVDKAAEPASAATECSSDGLGIQDNESRLNSPVHLMATPTMQFPSLSIERRPSVLEDTIHEEASPIEVVEDYEEPRASMITKSSDSTETTTPLQDNAQAILSLPTAPASFMTPTTYAASTFSTPDLNRHQNSFDAARLGTSASSSTDCRTMKSYADGSTAGGRVSTDDVPSLTSSRSTMISSMHHGGSRRDISDRSASLASSSAQPSIEQQTDRRRKRSSIQSLTKLVGGPFGENRSKLHIESRPSLAVVKSSDAKDQTTKKKEHRLSRLMFWKHNRSSSRRVTD